MNSTKSYKWYFENGCEIVPLKQSSNETKKYSLTLLDIQADFSDVFKEKKEKKVETAETVTGIMPVSGGLFYKRRDELTHKDASAVIREKYVMEVDQLWAYIRWHYNFEDEIKIQKNLVSDFTKIRKVPKLHVSTHIIEGAIHDMSAHENICILKYTTFCHFSEKYKNELENLKKKSKMYNYCNYVYEVCDIADKSLLFSNSPVINTTVKNILSITKSGKKREDFNNNTEEEEADYSVDDEIWQVYISNRIESINDQWLLICINDKLKEIIESSRDIYFKIFNKYIKEYNEYLHSHDYNTTDKTGIMDEFNSSFSNDSTSTASTLNTQFHQAGKDLRGYEKYKVNLIFSENKDINYVIYKLCIKLGRMNDVVLCTKRKSYNIMMNDIDGTLAICFKPFLSKYFQNTKYENQLNVLSNGIIQNNSTEGSEIKGNESTRRKLEIGNINKNEDTEDEDDDFIKTISIMGLCKEKMLLFEKATIFSNVDLLYSYFLLVHTDALNISDVGDGNDNTKRAVGNIEYSVSNNNNNNKNNNTVNNDVNNNINNNSSSNYSDIDNDGIIYLSRKALFENIQFSNEEISSYLLHLQKYSNSNLLYIKNKGFRYMKNETLYEFLIKLLELISLHDDLYEEQKVEKTTMGNPLFTKYQEDLYKVQKQRYGITFTNLYKIITDNINEFQFFQLNRLPIEKYVVLQMCLKCCDIENKHFEYFSLYYNYYFFYEYLNKESDDLCYEDIFDNYLSFLLKDHQIDETIVYFNLYKLHKLTALNILRTSGRVDVYSDKLFTFDIKMETYVKYIDGVFKSMNSNLMDKIITYFIKNYQFFLDYGYNRKEIKRENKMGATNSGIDTVSNTASGIHKFSGKDGNANKSVHNNNDDDDDINLEMDRYRNRVFFRNNAILNVSNINHICNDEYMFQYFIVVKYYYNDNSFGLLETKLKKFIKKAEEDFIVAHQKAVEFDIDKKFKINWQKLRSNYCLNYKIYKYQTIPFPHIRLKYNYNDLLNTVYSPLSIHFSIFHENVIYNKKQNSFQLIPSFLLKDYLRSCLTTLYTLKNSYYAQELYPFLNPLLYNKDLIGTIAVPPLRHCRTKLIEKENEKNVEFIEMDNIVTSTLNNDMKRYRGTNLNTRKKIEKLCKLYNCNLPVNNFNY